jgi:hypothetical protein
MILIKVLCLNLKKKRNEKKEKKPAVNLPKNPLCVIGLREKEPKARKVDGLIVMRLMEKAATNHVAVHQEKKEKSTLHVVLLLVHAR